MNDACHICGESDNLVPVTINNETIYLCPECKENHLKQCSQCDDFFIDTENDFAVSRDGEIYCEFCRDEYLTYCEHCDEYSDSEDFVHLVNTDEWWCRSCAERQSLCGGRLFHISDNDQSGDKSGDQKPLFRTGSR